MRHGPRFGQHVLRKHTRKLVLADHHLHVNAKVIWIAQHLNDSANRRTCRRWPTGDLNIDNETFKIGVVEGKVINIKEIEALASMPSKEELYSKLLFLINAPAQRLATAINAVPRNLAVVIDQAVQQKKFKEA